MLKRLQGLTTQFNALANRLANDPAYRLRSYAEVAQAARLGYTLDVNRATVDDWLRLPGLSIRQAQSLVRLRQGGVQFHCAEDVAAALGVSPAALVPLAPVLSFRFYDDPCGAMPTVGVNQATVPQLCGVPGLSAELAQRIVQERSHRGPYRDLADLQQRLYLPPDQLQTLLYYLRP